MKRGAAKSPSRRCSISELRSIYLKSIGFPDTRTVIFYSNLGIVSTRYLASMPVSHCERKLLQVGPQEVPKRESLAISRVAPVPSGVAPPHGKSQQIPCYQEQWPKMYLLR